MKHGQEPVGTHPILELLPTSPIAGIKANNCGFRAVVVQGPQAVVPLRSRSVPNAHGDNLS